jgi:excisionase family DNA binding protein
MTSNYLTTSQAAHRLGVSVRTVQQWVERGMLTSWKTEGGHRRLDLSAVEALATRTASTQALAARERALKLLIVEDDAAMLRLYRARIALWELPVQIFSAPNGYEGLVMVGETQPQLLVCDLRLPGVNGFEIVRSLRRMDRYRTLDVVVVSGLAENEVQAHGGLPDRVELMGKPVDFQRLQSIACAALQQIGHPRSPTW